MIPDLGAYATEVTLAYAGALLAIAAIIWLSVWQARRVKKRLDALEATRQGRS